MNKNLILSLALWCAGSIGGVHAQIHSTRSADYRVVPLPQRVELTDNKAFVPNSKTVICYPKGNPKVESTARFLAEYLHKSTGLTFELKDRSVKNNAIRLQLSPAASIPPEGYTLQTDCKGITLTATTESGLFYGVQTLRKASENFAPTQKYVGPVQFPAVQINDAPRFAYRGMHLDVSRHFFSIDFIKRYIDLLALHHFNTFHWHLTDDQGWRMEIKALPKLTACTDFYTQPQLREVVDYAAERHITVIPEIDLPGHTTAALAAYPELGCTGGPYQVSTTYGVHKDVLCIGNPQSLNFAQKVLDEVMAVFPSRQIHLGGDECPRERWKACPKCQSLIRKHNLPQEKNRSAEDQLQSYFMENLRRYLNEHGREMIGWDEVMDGGIDTSTTVMCWRDADKVITAARKGHHVIATPAGITYFGRKELEGTLGLERVYQFNPMTDSLLTHQQARINGLQGCVWTEHLDNPHAVEQAVLPRLAALSEIAWTEAEKHDFQNFLHRLYPITGIYAREGWNYSKEAYNLTSKYSVDSLKHALKIDLSTLGDRPIYYTLNGTQPTVHSSRYVSPILLNQSTRLRAKVIAEPTDTSRTFCSDIEVNKATFKPVTLTEQPHRNYTFNGASTLVDGIKGESNYNSGLWLGFLTDVDMVVDLLEPTDIEEADFSYNVAKSSAIMGPTRFEVWASNDGNTYKKIAETSYPVLEQTDKDGIFTKTLKFEPVRTRYVRLIMGVTPKLPKWHMWPGADAFLFIDEIGLK